MAVGIDQESRRGGILTYHLDKDTPNDDDRKDISTYMGQLVVASKRQF